MSKNRLIVKGNNSSVLLREVIGSSLTALSGNLVLFIFFSLSFFFLFLSVPLLICGVNFYVLAVFLLLSSFGVGLPA